MSDGPDALHQRLLKDNERLRRERDAARGEINRLRHDPRTGFLREPFLLDHLGAILRRHLTAAGARKLLRGVNPTALPDDEFEELQLSFVVLTPTYPNPALETMLGLSEVEPMLDRALVVLRLEVRSHLTNDRLISGLAPDEETEVLVPMHIAGHLDDRLVALCLAEPPRMSARMAREIAQGVRTRTSGLDVSQHVLPFRFDYGGSSLVEAIAAAGAFFRRFPRGSNVPAIQVEIVRRLLVGIACERARESCELASAALQARLKHACLDLLNLALGYLFVGESVLESRLQDALIHASLTEGVWNGPPKLDGAQLERALEDLGRSRLEARISSLACRAREHTLEHASATQIERLILLSAHSRLGEF